MVDEAATLKGVRGVALEITAIFLIAVLLVAAALGTFVDGSYPGWFDRTVHLLGAAITFKFGVRLESTTDTMFRAMTSTLFIIAGTAALLLIIAVPVGIANATRSNSLATRSIRRLISAISTMPVLIWATLIYVVAARGFGMELMEDVSPVAAIIAAIGALLFGDRILADMVQRVEVATRDVMAEPYMRLARAAGLGYRRHLVQSLLPPIAESLAARSMFLIGGAIVVERMFAVRGLGFNVVHALQGESPDTRLALAGCVGLIAIGVAFRVAHRATVLWADPRRRG